MANLNNLISLTTLFALILALCIARTVQVAVIAVLKRYTKSYADIKRRHSLDEWEQKFDD